MRKLLIIVSLAGSLLAQPPRGPRPWWDSDIAKNANLSDVQEKQIRQMQHDYRGQMLQARQAVDKANADLAAVFNEDPVDQTKANDAINRLAAAHADLTRTVSQFSLKVRSVLTAEQWQAMQHGRPDRPNLRRRGGQTTTPTTQPQK